MARELVSDDAQKTDHGAADATADSVHSAATVERLPRLDVELRHAQKLEALGQLAAGIAHEISTPVQFVGDSVSFLRGALGDLEEFARAVQRVANETGPRSADDIRADLRKIMEASDVSYLIDRVPRAVDRVVDGLARVSSIVRAMKDFSHPDQREKLPTDLNEAVERTLVITRGEYKHVADIQLELTELPRVHCHMGDIQQVLVNLLINASHAIEARIGEDGARGRIVVRTFVETQPSVAAAVVIAISDDGGGIPADVQPHVFEAFFTTKPLGRGTGQGLAISRSIVVDRHGGTLDFETEPGRGTTFFLRIPV